MEKGSTAQRRVLTWGWGKLGNGEPKYFKQTERFPFLFFFNVDTHPYERTYVNPISMSIFKDWAGKSED